MRDHRRATPGLLLVFALMLLAGGWLAKPSPASAQNDDGTWKQVTVLYMSDTRGQFEPCG